MNKSIGKRLKSIDDQLFNTEEKRNTADYTKGIVRDVSIHYPTDKSINVSDINMLLSRILDYIEARKSRKKSDDFFYVETDDDDKNYVITYTNNSKLETEGYHERYVYYVPKTSPLGSAEEFKRLMSHLMTTFWAS